MFVVRLGVRPRHLVLILCLGALAWPTSARAMRIRKPNPTDAIKLPRGTALRILWTRAAGLATLALGLEELVRNISVPLGDAVAQTEPALGMFAKWGAPIILGISISGTGLTIDSLWAEALKE